MTLTDTEHLLFPFGKWIDTPLAQVEPRYLRWIIGERADDGRLLIRGGLRRAILQILGEPLPATIEYHVAPGTPCQIRRLGTPYWRDYQTRRPIACIGYRWRNETHYGLHKGGWEIKVAVGRFTQREV